MDLHLVQSNEQEAIEEWLASGSLCVCVCVCRGRWDLNTLTLLIDVIHSLLPLVPLVSTSARAILFYAYLHIHPTSILVYRLFSGP